MMATDNLDTVVARSRVIDRKQWQELSGLSDAVIRRLDERGDGPALVRLSPRRVGYMLGDCLDWLEARKEGSTVQARQTSNQGGPDEISPDGLIRSDEARPSAVNAPPTPYREGFTAGASRLCKPGGNRRTALTRGAGR